MFTRAMLIVGVTALYFVVVAFMGFSVRRHASSSKGFTQGGKPSAPWLIAELTVGIYRQSGEHRHGAEGFRGRHICGMEPRCSGDGFSASELTMRLHLRDILVKLGLTADRRLAWFEANAEETCRIRSRN
jgi:hypothetical protein